MAADDAAETAEDEPLVIDVLANDTDVDGDVLRIVSATAPAHGTATAGAGGVRYAPALNYHGQDSFDYTIADQLRRLQRRRVSDAGAERTSPTSTATC